MATPQDRMALFNTSHDIPGYIYAALIANGGIMGYVRRGSLISLVAGGASGILAGYGAYRVSQNPKDVYLSLGVSALLTLAMGQRLLKTGKFMPAGLVSVLSLIMATRYGMRLQ